jgi:CBS domain-containing protein
MAVTVKDILTAKGNNVWSISPDAQVYDALKMLDEKNVGALVVLEGDKVVGIFSERDYARKVYLQGKSSRNTTVRGVMTPDVISVRNDTPLNECMSLMTLKRIRHLPVIEGGRLAGIITVGDVVKSATGG